MAQRKNPELDAKHQAILRKMMQLPENKTCADCKGPSPRWASTNLGIFLCISCSGIHRKLGTHISQVRSVTLDTWTPAQIAHFTKFGNARAAQYFEACIPEKFQRPPHGDAMRMERFIRDKYEIKRYITVENGGLGGQETGPTYGTRLGSSYVGTLGPRPPQVRGTLSYTGGGYDNAQSVRRTGTSSNSYSNRFGSGSHSMGGGSSFSQTGITGSVMSQSATGRGRRPGNAMQRAGTMKELINMGFSAQHAARAVEATEGDLQNAVDWVLEHADTGARGNGVSSAQRPYQQAQQRDLLDFDEPVPAPKVTSEPARSASARPKAMGNDSLMSTASKANRAPIVASSEADFADFGAFESALPTATKIPQASSPTGTNGSLSATIQTIYKQSPPLRSNPTMSGMPHMTRIDQLKPTGTPKSPARTKPSPKLMAMKADAEQARKNMPQADLGLTSFTGLAHSQKALSSAANNTPHVRNLPLVGETSATVDPATPPPPPPPQVFTATNRTDGPASPTPPPPDTPPPDVASSKHAETVGNIQQNSQSPENDTHDKSVQKPVSQEKEEEDDPFAALSMMAMKTAKSSSKKKTVTPPMGSQFTASSTANTLEQMVGSGENKSASSKPALGFDLDELLG